MKENNIKLDKKLSEVVKQNETYANCVKNIETVAEGLPKQVNAIETPNLRTIMQETQNEQLAEQTDQRQRECNIIIHGIEEAYETDENKRKQNDETYVHSLFNTVAEDISYKSITRIGKVDNDIPKKRSMKVVMKSVEVKHVFMSNLRNLKGKDEFNGIS